MVDAYYSDTLPQNLQELDDVYHDVSAVVAETLIQGADIISIKVRKYSCILYTVVNIELDHDKTLSGKCCSKIIQLFIFWTTTVFIDAYYYRQHKLFIDL